MKKVVKVGKGYRTYYVRSSRAKRTKNLLRKEAREIVREIYPELQQKDKYYWRIYMVHHIDKNPFNNDPNNLAIILKNDHWLHHRRKYEWEDRECPRCNKETIHLNIRCTECHYKNKGLTNEIPQPIRA